MYKTLGKQVIFTLFFLFTVLQAGSVSVNVDNKNVSLGDTLLFTLTVVAQERTPLPEMDEIAGVKIENIITKNGSDFVYVNGESVMMHSQTITFELKPTKNMTIPGFQVMVDGVVKTTKEIKIKVVKAQVGQKPKNKYFSLEMTLNKSEVYMGEPIIVTVYLRVKTVLDIMNLDYTAPKFKDFFSKQLNAEKSYKEGSDTVHEITYLLSPKKEGSFDLEVATAKIAQRIRERQTGGWFLDVPQWSNIASNKLEVKVLKLPKKHDVVGEFLLTQSISNLTVQANKPVNLKIVLKGEGNLDALEPLEFKIDGVTFYRDDAEVKSTYKNQILETQYIQSFTFISDYNFVIPSKRIEVFNYKTGKTNILKTKTYKIEVLGSKKAIQKEETFKGNGVNPLSSPIEKAETQTIKFTFSIFLILLLTFILGIVTTLFFKQLFSFNLLDRWKKLELFNGHESLKILYPYVREDDEVEAMVRDLYAIRNGEKNVTINKELLKELLTKYQPTISKRD